MMVIIEDIEGIGSVTFKSFKRSKSIKIIVKPFKGVIVTYPVGISKNKAKRFLLDKADLIKQAIAEMKIIEKGERQRAESLRIKDKVEVDRIIRNAINLHSLEKNLPFGRLTIRQQKTRWGSCSSQNNISLNRYLVFLPKELMDYVIIHELVHTKVKNHGKEFWQLLETHYPDYKNAVKALRKFRLPQI